MISTGLPNFIKKEINDNLEIQIIQINECCEAMTLLLDEYFVHICKGRTKSSPETVKKNIHKYLKNKNISGRDEKEKTLLYGAIAEFFIHLHLNSKDYKQECLFKNLEENSIKKGFDGLYSKAKDYWVMESKSGFITTENIHHKGKVQEAYQDLKSKIAGKSEKSNGVPNNPWENAYNHATLRDVNASDSLTKVLQELQDDFTEERYHDIDDFNVIPCSTIFLLDKDIDGLFDDIEDKIIKWHMDNAIKKTKVICINFKAIEFFLEYIIPKETETTC